MLLMAWNFVVDVLTVSRLTADEKSLAIRLLRQQLRIAERWVRNVREECLDHLIILNEHHQRRDLRTYTLYYHERRPHPALAHSSPCGCDEAVGAIDCRPVLGGIFCDYYREAA